RLRDLDLLGGGFGVVARSDEVRPAADQVDGERRWEAGAGEGRALGRGDVEAAVRALAQQRRESVAGAGDLAVDRSEVGIGGGDFGFRLVEPALVLETVAQALVDQARAGAANANGVFGRSAVGVEPHQFGVSR